MKRQGLHGGPATAAPYSICARRDPKGLAVGRFATQAQPIPSQWAIALSKVGMTCHLESGMFFATHCDPHDSSPQTSLRCQSPQRWKYPTHRSKSWEELAKRRASSRYPSHQAGRKPKAGENSLRAGVGPALFFAHSATVVPAATRHSVTVARPTMRLVFRRDTRALIGRARQLEPTSTARFSEYLQIAMAKAAQIDET